MKKLFIVLVLFFSAQLHSQSSPFENLEIVESTPIGTTLDNPDIRNTREVWVEMIDRAQRSLDIEQFYIANEPRKLLEDVLAAIYRAADRGVKVRVMVDAGMYKTYLASVDSLGKYRNIEARRLDFHAIAGGIQHAKYFIVDEKEVFIGSQNFDWRALEHIHELGLRINDKQIASSCLDVFNFDWQLCAPGATVALVRSRLATRIGKPVRMTGRAGETATLSVTSSPVGWLPDSSHWDEHAIVNVIHGARKSLTLQFLGYSTLDRRDGSYAVIDSAIRDAAKRGVKVRMIVADWEKGSPGERSLKELSVVPNVKVAFTSIPDWAGGYISFARVEHCKYVVADNSRFWLGSCNCEKSYFYSTRNLGVVCTSPVLANTLARIFDKSWNSPYKELVTHDGSYAPRKHGEN